MSFRLFRQTKEMNNSGERSEAQKTSGSQSLGFALQSEAKVLFMQRNVNRAMSSARESLPLAAQSRNLKIQGQQIA